MDYKDYYQIMGLARDATQDDIKRAYRKLARKFHPDVSKQPDAEARFKDLGEAYEVLKDPEKRAAYDQLGNDWRGGQDFRPPPGWDQGFEFSGGGSTGAGEEGFSDFFETLFGRQGPGRRRQRRPFGRRGQDHHAKVTVSLADTYDGATRAISLGMPQTARNGQVTTRDRVLNVRVPKGVRPGQQIRLAGQGAPGIGEGAAGDLYLEIQIESKAPYQLDGVDVHVDLPVAPWEAALGATVSAPTPTGRIDLKIPAGSRQGRRLRLKGRGIPSPEPGDLYVVLRIELPPADTDKARALYEQMRDELEFDPRADMAE